MVQLTIFCFVFYLYETPDKIATFNHVQGETKERIYLTGNETICYLFTNTIIFDIYSTLPLYSVEKNLEKLFTLCIYKDFIFILFKRSFNKCEPAHQIFLRICRKNFEVILLKKL